MQPHLQAVFAGLLGLLLGAWLMQRLRTQRDRTLARARNARGKRGEDRAEALLIAAGYEIVARQRRSAYKVWTDASELTVTLAVDFVVRRAGRELVAEVKTGSAGTQLRSAETRRQLLEYQLASGAQSVLLVDPERARITELSFPFAAAVAAEPEPAAPLPEVAPIPTARSKAAWLWLALALAAVVVWLALRAHAHACAA